MRWSTNPTARILLTFRAIMTATTSRIWLGTSFRKTTPRLKGGSMNGSMVWKIMPPMCESLDEITLISSSRTLCWRRRLITEDIDERNDLYGFGNDDCSG